LADADGDADAEADAEPRWMVISSPSDVRAVNVYVSIRSVERQIF
jgi:hypothetical protein